MRFWIDIINESYVAASKIEEWREVSIFGIKTLIGWQNDKNQANLKKHKIDLSIGIDVLTDPVMTPDPHELDNKFIGNSRVGILTVAAQWLNEYGDETDTGEEQPMVRIISVRPATQAEKSRYQGHRPLTEEESLVQILDPDNPPIVDFSHFISAEEYWKTKLKRWIEKKT